LLSLRLLSVFFLLILLVTVRYAIVLVTISILLLALLEFIGYYLLLAADSVVFSYCAFLITVAVNLHNTASTSVNRFTWLVNISY